MGGEERAECECMCESAGLFSVVSPLPARCSPSVSSRCVRGREGAGEPLSPLSLSLSPSPLPSLFVCVCGCVVAGGGERERKAREEARGRGGDWRRGEEDAGPWTPTDDWLRITRGTRGARGPAPLHKSSPRRRSHVSPPARRSPSPRPAPRAAGDFLLLAEIIVWKGWKEGVSATLALRVCACAGVCVNKLVWVFRLG